MVQDQETGDMVMAGMGELHLEVGSSAEMDILLGSSARRHLASDHIRFSSTQRVRSLKIQISTFAQAHAAQADRIVSNDVCAPLTAFSIMQQALPSIGLARKGNIYGHIDFRISEIL